MVSSSTNVENPVNQIASLLSAEDAPQKKDENPETVETTDENLSPADESQPQDESLAEEEVEESAESSEEEGIDTLNNLAEELDIDISDMYALNLNLSRGENLPEGGAITLGELKTFYEKNVDIDSVRTELQNKRVELETQSEQVSELPKVSNELLQARAQVLAIQQTYDNTDWNGIRHTNPGEYAALQSDFRGRFEAAKHQEMLANQEFEGNKAKNTAYQRDRLFETMPELKDDAVRVQVANDVQEFAKKFGFTPKEIEDVEDHRLMRMLITASKADKARTTVAEKKIDSTPKSHKPAARKSLPGRKASLKRLTDKARSTGQIKDQANAVHELLKGL